MDEHYHLGLDLGGTNIKGIVVTADGRVVAQGSTPTPSGGPDRVLEGLIRHGKALAEDRKLATVGIAFPGVVDASAGRVFFLPNVGGDWGGRPIASEVAAGLGAPTALLNDVRAATFGELHFGAGRDCRTFAMIAVGTGIGGGIVVDGELYLGARGHAGEVGHVALELRGPTCACTGWGCAEALAGTRALEDAARDAVREGRPTTLARIEERSPGGITPRAIAEAAAQDDAVASEILAEEAYRLGILASNLVVVLDPERIIVGGGIASAGDALLDGIRRTVEERVGWFTRYAPVEIVPAELGDRAGAFGAAAWGRRRQSPG